MTPANGVIKAEKAINDVIEPSSDSEDEHDHERSSLVSNDSVKSEDRTTFWGMTANLTLAGLGTGILNMPQCMASAGVFNAVLWIMIGLFLNYMTNYIIIRAGHRYKVYELEDLMLKIPGAAGQNIKSMTVVALWVMMLLVFSGYYVAFKDFFMKVIAHFAGEFVPGSAEEALYARCLMGLGALLVLPLCFLKQNQLSRTSTISICINLFMMVVVAINFFLEAWQAADPVGAPTEKKWQQKGNVCFWSNDIDGNLTIYSMIMMAAVIQPCVLPMYRTMENRSPEAFARCMQYSYFFLTCIFSLFAFLAYATYGPSVQGTVTNNLSMARWQNLAVCVGMSFVVLTVYPILLIPMISPLKEQSHKTAATVVVVFGTLCLSLTMLELATLNIWCGIISGLFFIGVIPSVIGYYFLAKTTRERVNGWGRWTNWRWVCLFAIGLTGAVFGYIFDSPELGIQHIFRGYVVRKNEVALSAGGKVSVFEPMWEVRDFDSVGKVIADYNDFQALQAARASSPAAAPAEVAKQAKVEAARAAALLAKHEKEPKYFAPVLAGEHNKGLNALFELKYDGFRPDARAADGITPAAGDNGKCAWAMAGRAGGQFSGVAAWQPAGYVAQGNAGVRDEEAGF